MSKTKIQKRNFCSRNEEKISYWRASPLRSFHRVLLFLQPRSPIMGGIPPSSRGRYPAGRTRRWIAWDTQQGRDTRSYFWLVVRLYVYSFIRCCLFEFTTVNARTMCTIVFPNAAALPIWLHVGIAAAALLLSRNPDPPTRATYIVQYGDGRDRYDNT